MDFGRSFTARIIVLNFALKVAISRTTYFHVRVNPFVRTDDAQLRDTGQNIVAIAKSDRKTLQLTACFWRSGNRSTNLGDPGTYAGSVTIDDRSLVTPVTVPITVTMEYPNGTFLIWLWVGAIIPGAWCLWVLRDKQQGTRPAFSRQFIGWLLTISGLVSVVVGSVAAFAVYVAVYLRNQTWGSSALQALTLYGAMFSAFVTTGGIASLASLTHQGQENVPGSADKATNSPTDSEASTRAEGAPAFQGGESPGEPHPTEGN